MLPKLFNAFRAPAEGSPLAEIVKALDALSGRPADPGADTVAESYTEIVREKDGRVTVRHVERRVEKGGGGREELPELRPLG